MVGEHRYVIHIAARLVGVQPRTIRYYEQLGLLEERDPRDQTYSDAEVARLRLIRRLVNDLGVNLAGAEVILNMRERLLQLHRELDSLRRELDAAGG